MTTIVARNGLAGLKCTKALHERSHEEISSRRPTAAGDASKQLLKNVRARRDGLRELTDEPYAAVLKLGEDHRVRLDFEGV